MLADPEGFRGRFFGGSAYAGNPLHHPEAMNAYLVQLKQEDAVHSMCEDYRAGATVDLEEAREDRRMGRKIKCPVRVLWGKNGAVGKCFDTLAEWRAVSDGSVEGEAVDSGHYIAEEVPDVVLTHAKDFFCS